MSKMSPYGTMIPAGLFIGIGVGLWTNQVLACVLIGFGLGLAFAHYFAAKNH
jgi:hypothetical protein